MRYTEKALIADKYPANYVSGEHITHIDGSVDMYMGSAIDRLAAFEDGGLEPCDYAAMKAAVQESAELRQQLAEVVQMLGCESVEHLRLLAQNFSAKEVC